MIFAFLIDALHKIASGFCANTFGNCTVLVDSKLGDNIKNGDKITVEAIITIIFGFIKKLFHFCFLLSNNR